MNKDTLDKLVNEYHKNGFVMIKSIIDEKDLDTARKEVEAFFEKDAKQLSGKNINKVNGKINSIHCLHQSKWFDDYQHTDVIQKLVTPFLGSEGECRGAELFAKPAHVGLASPIHQDNYYWCVDDANALTIWVALDDANSENGGVFYYKGTHKLGLLEHKPSYAPGSSQTLKYPESMEPYKKITPSLKAGDCLIHHSLIVHGSNANTSSFSRKGWTMQFKSKDSGYDQFMQERYQRSLNEQLAQRANNS